MQFIYLNLEIEIIMERVLNSLREDNKVQLAFPSSQAHLSRAAKAMLVETILSHLSLLSLPGETFTAEHFLSYSIITRQTS